MLLRFARSHQLRVRKRAPGRSMASYIWLETRFCRRDPWGHQGLSGRQAVPDVLAVPGFLSSLVFLSSLFLPAAIRDLLVTRPHVQDCCWCCLSERRNLFIISSTAFLARDPSAPPLEVIRMVRFEKEAQVQWRFEEPHENGGERSGYSRRLAGRGGAALCQYKKRRHSICSRGEVQLCRAGSPGSARVR